MCMYIYIHTRTHTHDLQVPVPKLGLVSPSAHGYRGDYKCLKRQSDFIVLYLIEMDHSLHTRFIGHRQ